MLQYSVYMRAKRNHLYQRMIQNKIKKEKCKSNRIKRQKFELR